MMQVLVMGGTGFIGGALTRSLVEAGYEVDIFSRGMKTWNSQGHREHLVGDRRDRKSLKEQMDGRSYDVIFDINAYDRNDVELFLDSIDVGNLKHYILCSSGAVYKTCETPADENAPRGLNQHWGEYGLHKKEAEDALMRAGKQEGIPYTIIRPSYVYGKGNSLYREAYFFDRISEGLPIPIPSGHVTTQFIHIDDLVGIFLSIIGKENAIGECFNATYPEAVTWVGLIEAIMSIVGSRVELISISDRHFPGIGDGNEVRSYFPFRNVTYLLNGSKVVSYGLHAPNIGLYHGLKTAYEWYLHSPHGLHDPRMDSVDIVLGKIAFE